MLSQGDFRKISEFLQQVYTICTPEELMFRLPLLIHNVISSEVPTYCSVNHTERKVLFTASPHYPGLAGRVIDNCDDHPGFNRFIQLGNPQAYLISDFINERQLHQLEGVYQSYLRPMGMEEQLGLALPPFHVKDYAHKKRNGFDGIGLHRSRRSFTEQDRLIFNLLYSHIIQAQQNSIAFAKMQQTLAQSNQALEQAGTVILSVDGQVKLMTKRAKDLLTRYFFDAGNQLPQTVQGWFRHQLSLLNVDGDMPPSHCPLQVEYEDRRLTVRLICDRSREQYLLLLEEQPSQKFSIATLELVGLTQREAEVLYWVAKDKNNAEIGQIIGCSSNTVRKHLEHIFEKLGVQTRIAAVIVALEKLGLFAG